MYHSLMETINAYSSYGELYKHLQLLYKFRLCRSIPPKSTMAVLVWLLLEISLRILSVPILHLTSSVSSRLISKSRPPESRIASWQASSLRSKSSREHRAITVAVWLPPCRKTIEVHVHVCVYIRICTRSSEQQHSHGVYCSFGPLGNKASNTCTQMKCPANTIYYSHAYTLYMYMYRYRYTHLCNNKTSPSST